MPKSSPRAPAVTRPRIQIAGRGAVSCFGGGHDALIESVFAGAVGIRALDRLAGTECLTGVAAEVPRSIWQAVDSSEELAFHLACSAAREALVSAPDGELAFVLASTKADMRGIVTEGGEGLGNPGRLARRIAGELGLRGPVAAVSCACASGLAALAFAGRRLHAGQGTRALVVGTDCLNPFILRGFSSLLALSPDPCRPFDRHRRGLSLGDGAAAILLSTNPGESLGFSLDGWGESNDAHHVTGPCRDGSGLALAIERALAHADAPPASVDYVHLHGTGTVFNDSMEQRALAISFDTVPPASGTKGQHGHTLGAAGVLESLITLAALERGQAPANVGLRSPDEDSPVTLAGEAVCLPRSRTAIKVAAGFGGINAALVFRRDATP